MPCSHFSQELESCDSRCYSPSNGQVFSCSPNNDRVCTHATKPIPVPYNGSWNDSPEALCTLLPPFPRQTRVHSLQDDITNFHAPGASCWEKFENERLAAGEARVGKALFLRPLPRTIHPPGFRPHPSPSKDVEIVPGQIDPAYDSRAQNQLLWEDSKDLGLRERQVIWRNRVILPGRTARKEIETTQNGKEAGKHESRDHPVEYGQDVA